MKYFTIYVCCVLNAKNVDTVSSFIPVMLLFILASVAVLGCMWGPN